MGTMLTVENAATWFNAKTVTHHLDVVDRQAEDGRLYAILKDDDCTREEPVGGRAGGPELRVRRARDGDPALLRGRSRLPALSMTRPGAQCSAERKEKRA